MIPALLYTDDRHHWRPTRPAGHAGNLRISLFWWGMAFVVGVGLWAALILMVRAL